jgi:hypothetical protein
MRWPPRSGSGARGLWDAMTNEQLLESLQPSAATVEAVRPRSPDPGAGFAKASRQLGGDQRRAWERTGRV